jgi:hypothetical protein
MTTAWNVTAPHLSDEEAAKVIAAGGLTDGADPGETSRGILVGLQSKPMYGGTVDHATIAKRRIKNKLARKARRIARRS